MGARCAGSVQKWHYQVLGIGARDLLIVHGFQTSENLRTASVRHMEFAETVEVLECPVVVEHVQPAPVVEYVAPAPAIDLHSTCSCGRIHFSVSSRTRSTSTCGRVCGTLSCDRVHDTIAARQLSRLCRFLRCRPSGSSLTLWCACSAQDTQTSKSLGCVDKRRVTRMFFVLFSFFSFFSFSPFLAHPLGRTMRRVERLTRRTALRRPRRNFASPGATATLLMSLIN